jgi:hypothetical protein
MAKVLEEKLEQKLKERSELEKEMLEKVKTSMMEVFQEQTEKFYRNISARSQTSDSLSASPINRSRAHSQSNGIEQPSLRSSFKSKSINEGSLPLKKQTSTFQPDSVLDQTMQSIVFNEE